MEKLDAKDIFNPIFQHQSLHDVTFAKQPTTLDQAEVAIKATQNILMDIHAMLTRIADAETLGEAQLAAEDALFEIKKIGFTGG